MRRLWLLLMAASAALAQVDVAASYPAIAEVARAIGGDRVNVRALANAQSDPHFVTPKPSLIATLRRADLLIINGAELEIGWLPAVIGQANNPQVRPGQSGFLDLSQTVTLLEIPDEVSRAGGDVHPAGNPHFFLDPHNILPMAEAIADRLMVLDTAHMQTYAQNLERFKTRWQHNLTRWEKQMASARGLKVAQYHGIYTYFLARYGIEPVITLEPLPGIPPHRAPYAKGDRHNQARKGGADFAGCLP